jgi:hypothetical protein
MMTVGTRTNALVFIADFGKGLGRRLVEGARIAQLGIEMHEGQPAKSFGVAKSCYSHGRSVEGTLDVRLVQLDELHLRHSRRPS